MMTSKLRHFQTLARLSIYGLVVISTGMQPAVAAITIANENTTNPTLLYQGKPMFKVGPLPEIATLGLKWGSEGFNHRQWLDWMAANKLGYGRIYPESSYPWLPLHADGRIFPFKVVRWEQGRPIVDITRFNPAYWRNMAHVIEACAERGIVLQIQLYQRVYFQGEEGGDDGWRTNYFNPANNINKFPVPKESAGLKTAITDFVQGLMGQAEPVNNGYGLFQAMAEDTVWRNIHRQWVEHILAAIGDNGNVIIDLMNEGAFNKSITKAWVESTLDSIDRWEKVSGNDLRVGMDFDHLYKDAEKGDPQPLEYVLSNPRLDVIICEGSESHVVPTLVAGDRRNPLHKDLATQFRLRYRKPVISTNSPSRGPQEDPEALQLYQWYALMHKVQGVGVYAKDYNLDFTGPPVREYAGRSRILMAFFESLKDYTALQPRSRHAITGPTEYRLAMTSSKEAAVYLNTGKSGDPVDAGARLTLNTPELPNRAVTINAVDPRSGRSSRWRDSVRGGKLEIKLPAFDKDIALHIAPLRDADAANAGVQ